VQLEVGRGSLAHPGDVLLSRRGVDDDQEMVAVARPHDDHVVDDAPRVVAHHRVQQLVGHQPAGIVGHQSLHELGGVLSDFLEKRSGEKVIYQRLAYLMRSGVPDSLAQLVAFNFGSLAADAVVVGWTRGFTFDAVDRAARAVRGGSRLIGTNEDATFPTPEGLVPEAGALLAAVATAAETTPEVAGKPHRATADALTRMVPEGDMRAMVGDRPATDGALAAQLGIPFALVFSGVTREGDPPAQGPAAAFSAVAASAGSASRFNGSASSDPDGTVARYDWSFGDEPSPSMAVQPLPTRTPWPGPTRLR